jgi:hypothetical protein
MCISVGTTPSSGARVNLAPRGRCVKRARLSLMAPGRSIDERRRQCDSGASCARPERRLVMCYEYDSYYLRARALEALRKMTPVADQITRPAAPAPDASVAPAPVPDPQPDTVPA